MILRSQQAGRLFFIRFPKLLLCCTTFALSRSPFALSYSLAHLPTKPKQQPPAPLSRCQFSIIQKMASSSSASEATLQDPVEQAGLPTPIILGSASFTRKLILKEMGVNYDIVVRPIDEKGIGDREKDEPSDLVLRLAKAKCAHLFNEIQNGNTDVDLSREWVVLTGDQVVTHNGKILEKPENEEEAKDFVARYGKMPPSTVGSCVLTHIPSGIQVSGVDTATIHFKETVATSNLIERLIADGEPVMSCAGGLMVEHPYVKEHLERIDGTEDSVMGLSKDLVLRLLGELSEKIKTQNTS